MHIKKEDVPNVEGLEAADWIIDLVVEKMSPGGAKYLKNNISKVNKALDNVKKEIDDAQYYVQDTMRGMIYEALRALKVTATYAEDIAENVSAVISFFVG